MLKKALKMETKYKYLCNNSQLKVRMLIKLKGMTKNFKEKKNCLDFFPNR